MSLFTHQHYDLIAATLRRDKPASAGGDAGMPASDAKRCQWRSLRERLVDLFTQDNPRFDANRFRAACD